MRHLSERQDGRAQPPRHTWLPDDLFIDGDELVDRSGQLRVPVLEALGMGIFGAAIRSFELLPHAERVTIGRTVMRRESWSVAADEIPRDARQLPALARERGMPGRLFAKSPLERKPVYLDVESPILSRILCRHARQAAAQAPGAMIRFTEMLPGPEHCWLRDPEENRYVSELRLVAVDRSHTFR